MKLPLSWLRFGGVAGLGLVLAVAASGARVVMLNVETQSGPAQFAADEIEAALKVRGAEVKRGAMKAMGEGTYISLVEQPGLKAEGFDLQVEQSGRAQLIAVLGSDPGGVMYGGLELAEQIRLGGLESVQPLTREPHFGMRGVKFNLPLDVRTPSYSDMSDSGQANIATVWDFEFWREFLDRLARHRYNYVSLWNLHPFPSLVRVPGYEDIALDDVQRSTSAFAEHYSTRTDDVVTPAMLAQVETVRKIPMDEKIGFWAA